MTRVFVISYSRLYAEGLGQLLSNDGRLHVVGCADGVTEALRMCTLAGPPDAVLVDIDMPHGGNAVRALTVAMPATRVIALVSSENDDTVLAWAAVAVAGVVARHASVDDLVDALQSAARAAPAWSPSSTATLLRFSSRRGPHNSVSASTLTSRERDVIALIDLGWTNKDIATELDIELPTVKNHVHHILTKLHASRRGEAAAILRGDHRSAARSAAS